MTAIDNSAFPRQKLTSYFELAPSLHLAVRAPLPPDFRIKRRIYDFFLCYVLQGELHVSIDANEPVAVPERTMVYFPAGVWHETWVASPQNVYYIGIHFDYFSETAPFLPEDITVNERNVRDIRFGAEPIIDGVAPFPARTAMSLSGQSELLLDAIVNEYHNQSPTYPISSRGLLLQLFALLWKERDRQRLLSPNAKYKEQLSELAGKMELSYHEPWTNERMARILNMHEDYVPKLFKLAFGTTPFHYLQHLRLQEAKRLLRETDMKVETIGRRVGYCDLHYFSRLFHKAIGLSPSEYRKSLHVF
ncbi:AraC family transcriptional regulator [Paenibacillus cymbidii]|uniref:AraC family transcriptional regulator n=1 Tax=Paenibacillus cymbidii TaxID=1639034 RepID=UPI001436A34B|nr:AraC family transcriptional regulator [Paenibacillus cymbidii]